MIHYLAMMILGKSFLSGNYQRCLALLFDPEYPFCNLHDHLSFLIAIYYLAD